MYSPGHHTTSTVCTCPAVYTVSSVFPDSIKMYCAILNILIMNAARNDIKKFKYSSSYHYFGYLRGEAYHIYHCNIITNPLSTNFVVKKVNSNAPLL